MYITMRSTHPCTRTRCTQFTDHRWSLFAAALACMRWVVFVAIGALGVHLKFGRLLSYLQAGEKVTMPNISID